MEIAATPPTTPPTIAPVFELLVTGDKDVRDLVGDVLEDVDVPDAPITVPGPSSGESI
jgi:hypothetical protein